jgi:hypothetical protein
LLNERVAMANLRYPSATDPVGEFVAGAYRVSVAPTNATNAPALLGPVPLVLRAGQTYTLVITGRASDRTLNLQLYADR